MNTCRSCKHINIGRSSITCDRDRETWGYTIMITEDELDTCYCDGWESREAGQ